MDIYSYLKKDHRKVSAMLDEIMATRSPAKRKEILEEIRHELLLHSETEKATFYATLESQEETRDWIKEAEEEHEDIKEFLEKLKKLPPDSEKWVEQFGEMKHCVTHHVEEEEGPIFKKAKQVLSDEQAKELALEMDMLKQKKEPKMQARMSSKSSSRSSKSQRKKAA